MKRFKSVILIVCAALSFASCEKEELDDHTRGTMGEYKPIFSFSLNGERRVTDDVYVNWLSSNSFEMVASIRDEHSSYQKVEMKIRFSALMKGAYPWVRNLQSTDLASTAQIKIGTVTYSADYAPAETSNVGNASIKGLNYASKYMEGTFDYTLYAPLNLQATTPPIAVRDGSFYYIGWE